MELAHPEQEKVTKKGPYTQYGALEAEGVNITWGDPADAAALPEGPFDVVYDNNGKTLDVCQPAIDAFKARVSQLRRDPISALTDSRPWPTLSFAVKAAVHWPMTLLNLGIWLRRLC